MTAAQRRSTALRCFAGSAALVTVLGHGLLGLEQAYLAPVVGVITGVTAEFVLETVEAWARGRPVRYRGRRGGRVVDFFLPSVTDGLVCAMLLYGNAHLMPVALAVLIAVGSKYVLRVRVPSRMRQRGASASGRHYLNPAAFGVVAVLLLFPWVGIAPPHQFTAWASGPFDAIVPLAVLVAGSMVNAQLTGKLPLILGWTGGFVLQGLVRGGLGDISVISALLPMTGVLFVLYTNYIITDPGTTPFGPRSQVVFGLATAAVYGLLVQFHIVFGLFLALVAVCAGRGAGLAVLARVHPAVVPLPAPAHALSEVPAGVQS
ncbi:enediyne biosynthesis protein UnbU [Streptosporangium sp. NPDC000396]|uniref:enediyne biosynthesis protein UnbU n=1 Tax=Streptosporangium sp. NPDC000396 TaxID=3366185 RepID=UPI0036C5CD50